MTIEENIRKRIIYILLFISILLVGTSSMLNTFQLGAQVAIVKDLSLTGIAFFGLLFTISLFLNLVPGEIEHRTIYPMLSQPITRAEYLWGKFLGILTIVAVYLMALGLELIIVLYRLEHTWNFEILKAVLMIIMQCGIIGATIILFSLITSYPLTLTIVSFVYFVGNISYNYITYLRDNYPRFLALFVGLIKLVLPKFDVFDIKDAIVHVHPVSTEFLISAFIYGILYTIVLMVLAEIIFERKDL
jgi:ABC-type transport system involved in multi-copper enzyme maturation permease subunit